MSESPKVVKDETQGSKACWVCETSIPYQQGWCQACWNALGEDRQKLVIFVNAVPDSVLQGQVFMAVSYSLKRERNPPKTHQKPVRINLDDLEVPFL